MHCCPVRLVSNSVAIVGGTVQVAVDAVDLKLETRYILKLAQPVPVDGYNLPVAVVVGADPPIPLQKHGVANIEFGEQLPKCRECMPLYYNNAGQFIDLRGHEYEGW